MHFEQLEVADDHGFPAIVTAASWGAPLKMGAIIQPTRATPQVDDPTHYEQSDMFVGGGTLIFWEGVIWDVVFCIVLAFFITYIILELKHEWGLRVEARKANST